MRNINYAKKDFKEVDTAVNRDEIRFNQDEVNRILCKVAQGKKIIILGANWKSVIFKGRYNIDIAYYAVTDYSEETYGKTYDGEEIRSIYDIAYEKPGTFYVVCADIANELRVQIRLLIEFGLKVYEDFCSIAEFSVLRNILMDDAHLHYSGQYELPGVKIFGDMGDKNAFRVAALGGSTTDPSVTCINGASWPQHLFDMLQRVGIPAVVFNLGTAAFASPREFIKLCRDGVTLEPNLVISYSGVNDLQPNQEFFTNRYNRPWIDHWTENQARKAGNHFNGKMSYGLQSDKTQAESWVTHIKMMRGVCSELGIKFAGFFQSFCGSNGEQSHFERMLLSIINTIYKVDQSSYNRAVYNVRKYEATAEYADSVTDLIKDIPYIFNKRYLFRDNMELLVDHCHTADAGNHLIAQNIFKTLLENGYLDCGGNNA